MSAYTVQPGDTLSKIAAKFGTTVQTIAAANHIANVNLIQVGQRLDIPTANDWPSTYSNSVNVNQPVTIDAATGEVEDIPTVVVTAPRQSAMPQIVGFDWRSMLKPPNLYYLIAAGALLGFALTKKRR